MSGRARIPEAGCCLGFSQPRDLAALLSVRRRGAWGRDPGEDTCQRLALGYLGSPGQFHLLGSAKDHTQGQSGAGGNQPLIPSGA